MNPPWWVPYIFLLILVLAAFLFTLQGRMTPAEFLAFGAALGFRAPSSLGGDKAENVQVEGEDVTVTQA